MLEKGGCFYALSRVHHGNHSIPHTRNARLLQLTGNIAFAGGLLDPVAALVLCTPGHVHLSVINGEAVISGGKLLTCDLEELVAAHNEASARVCAAVGSPDIS